MTDSKFDDMPRRAWGEVLKGLVFLPYHGALITSRRVEEYMKFMRFRADRIAYGYDSLSLERIRGLAETEPAPRGVPFSSRHFSVISGFGTEERLPSVIDGYALYAKKSSNPRPLHLFGIGALEARLREKVTSLELDELIVFRGTVRSHSCSRALASTLALLLVGAEEQSRLVVIKAQALGVPVIYSPESGARDEILRSGINGFLIGPDDPEGLAFFMDLVASNRALWERVATEALKAANQGDVSRFAAGVGQLCGARAFDAKF
ncbi:glycosyltransferase [Methylocystis echinoides]|uniref:glycosyltransferase n=1 Tax=Methylocystis echinoides TaxID=29468 RepID=UPI003417FF71